MPGVIRPWRLLLLALGLGLVIGGAWASAGIPRLTLLNAALRIDHPWRHGAGAAACAAGVAMLAASVSGTTLRRIGFILALGPLLLSIHLLAWRLEIAAAGLSFRGLLGTTRVAWPDVARIDLEARAIVVEAKGGERVRIDTANFAPDQRAAVERTLARHVQEHGGPTPRVVVPL
jgi:Bacterial PH domain